MTTTPQNIKNQIYKHHMSFVPEIIEKIEDRLGTVQVIQNENGNHHYVTVTIEGDYITEALNEVKNAFITSGWDTLEFDDPYDDHNEMYTTVKLYFD